MTARKGATAPTANRDGRGCSNRNDDSEDTRPSPDSATLPSLDLPAIRDLAGLGRRWVLWLYEDRGGPKPTKVPLRVDGTPASSTSPATWATFDDCAAAYVRGLGVGTGVVLNGDGLVGVDLDHCIGADGTVEPWALAIVRKIDSYTERSPSGTGLRVFGRGKLPAGRRKRGNVEAYTTERYLTVTGCHLDGTPDEIRDCGDALAAFHAEHLGGAEQGEREQYDGSFTGDVDELLEAIRSAHPKARRLLEETHDTLGYPSESEADMALASLLARGGFIGPQIEAVLRWRRRGAAKDGQYFRRTVERALGSASGGRAEARGAADAEWPTLHPFHARELPRIGADLLPAWAGKYAAALARATETPEELPLAMVLAACSATTARALRVQVSEGHSEVSNLWILLALPPGSRKSAVQVAAAQPLATWEAEHAEAMRETIARARSARATAEARAKALRTKAAGKGDARAAKEAADIEADLPEVPVAPVVWTSDATPERLGIMLAEQGEALAWLSAEGGVFDLLAGRYSGGALNLDLLLKAWSGDPERVDRVGRPAIYLREPRLTLGLATQPDVVSGLAAQPAFRGRGLLGRFLYVLPPDTVGTRECVTTPIPADVLAAYALGLRAMLDWRRPGAEGDPLRTVTLSPAAHREWHDFAVTIERELVPDGPLGSLRDWGSKLPGSAARVATVLHAIQHAHGEPWRHPIDVKTMDAALRIAARLREHAIAAYELLGADAAASAAERAWRWIAARRAPLLTLRDLLNGCRWLGRAAAAESAAEQLSERGYLRILRTVPSGPGRPTSPALEVRPDIVRGWTE